MHYLKVNYFGYHSIYYKYDAQKYELKVNNKIKRDFIFYFQGKYS
ncbi:hypothetical protein M079_1033 [Bacteroides fragilis str. 3996 N(B) 6]|uniref:Uncharacterized protein n=1 Tax=Bacteroides fragilis str. 3998T(B)3 TaxID=1339316 RepID=A0A015UAF0_BACFG|nr:hypothetical protein M079_1033 [Bacteroides fragilis str. 3996 N(B) 6]EXY91782.1 hypothetical protein M125_1476 [Bacteroides fragilis str. 3998T(B)3]